MAAPNPQLRAALNQFANEPGVTPQQVAELRAAIVGNPSILSNLNADASQGYLKGFSLAPPGTPSIGRYDVTTGTMILPPDVFTGGTSANSDMRATLRLQDMSLRFSQLPGVTPVMHDNLQRTINDSPALVGQFKDAVRSDQTNARHLRSFDLHTQGVAGGSYNPTTRAMNLVPASLTPGTFDQYNMSFVLGHEMEHGFNRAGVEQARTAFDAQVRAIASDSNPVNDYTTPSVRMMQVHRDNEAEAHIAGWNAMLSYERQRSGNPNAGLQEMWNNASRGRVVDFLGLDPGNNAVAKPGISFNTDGTLSSTPANVATMGRYYFDQPPAGTPGIPAQDTANLGPYGHSDYANFYGAEIVGRAIWAERNIGIPKHGNSSQMHLNLQRLGVNETLLEENGIYISSGSTASQVYHDTSTTPSTVSRFDHTYDGPNKNQHVPIDAPALGSPATTPPGDVTPQTPMPEPSAIQQQGYRHVSSTPSALPVGFAPALRIKHDLRDPDQPGHAAYANALDAVRQMEAKQGIASGEHTEILAARLTAEAAERKQGITHVEMGHDGQIKVIERHYAFDEGRCFSVNASEAMSQSMAQSSARWLDARSPHYSVDQPAVVRTEEQWLALSKLNLADQAMFSAIRGKTPAHIGDDTVAHAMTEAKSNGIHDASRIDSVAMFGNSLHVTGTIPGFRGSADVTAPVPSLMQSVSVNDSQNQECQQQLAQAQQQEQERVQGQARSISMG